MRIQGDQEKAPAKLMQYLTCRSHPGTSLREALDKINNLGTLVLSIWWTQVLIRQKPKAFDLQNTSFKAK